MRSVGSSPQFNGGRQAGRRYGMIRKFSRQLPPHPAAGLVKRGHSRIIGQQGHRGAHLGRQVDSIRPERCAQVDMHDGLIVTVQIQNNVCILGKGQEQVFQMAGFILRFHGAQYTPGCQADQ